MIQYFSFLISLLNPFNLIQPDTFVQSYVSKPSIVAMAPPPEGGNIQSRIANSAATPPEGCRQSTQTEFHNDGSETITTTITCSKKEKRRGGKTVSKTDTSQKKYRTAQKSFFGTASDESSSKK